MAQCSGYNGYRKITGSSNRSCSCKQPACPAGGGGSEVTFKPLVLRLSVREDFLVLTSPDLDGFPYNRIPNDLDITPTPLNISGCATVPVAPIFRHLKFVNGHCWKVIGLHRRDKLGLAVPAKY
ncbi:hypothetical protein J6590_027563 [Homalodisca vitripennis]|nr:hypothetical protein J6590_027563 [Homalodisca vitripennis]